MNRFVIAHISDETLLWSNTDGWTDGDNFDVFTLSDTELLNLPLEGKWMRLRSF